MNRLVLFPLILMIIYSCLNSPDSKKSNTSVVDMEQVKDSLSKWDEIPGDSIHVVKLKEKGLYITQGFGHVDNMIRLVKIYPNRFVVLDSILTFQEIDIYRQKKITYDWSNDWFIYSSISSGTGDLWKVLTVVRVENNHFAGLFTYSKTAGFVDTEDPLHSYSKWLNVTELEMNRKELILEAEFGSERDHTSVPSRIEIIDTLTFEFSKPLNKFILKKPINSFLKNHFWIRDGEYFFKI